MLVCGENNVLRNRQSEGNRCAGVRHHPGRELFEGVDVVLNGAHMIMGNWGKLSSRFDWLSRGGRVLAYTTNNTNATRGAWRSALRVHHDEREVADGVRVDSAWEGEPFAARVVRCDDARVVLLDGFPRSTSDA